MRPRFATIGQDPALYVRAWADAHAMEDGRIILFGGDSHDPFNDNSVRAIDPVTGAVEYLWPDTRGATGLKNRDNHLSFYVWSLRELWIISGSTGQWMGRFSVPLKQWVAIYDTKAAAEAFIAGISGYTHQERAAAAWSPTLNMGVALGGDSPISGVASKTMRAFKLVDGKWRYGEWDALPPPRGRCEGQAAFRGEWFYLYGGRDLNPGDTLTPPTPYTARFDFWRRHMRTQVWERLPDAPMTQGVLTYDERRDVFVAYGALKTAVFDPATNAWTSWANTALPWIGRYIHGGAYSPTTETHLYTGGRSYEHGVEVTADEKILPYARRVDALTLELDEAPEPPPAPVRVRKEYAMPMWNYAIEIPAVGGPVPPASYHFYRNGVKDGSEPAASPVVRHTYAFPDDGTHAFTVSAVSAEGRESAQGPALTDAFGPPAVPDAPTMTLKVWVA